MSSITHLDIPGSSTTFLKQLETETSPVTFINTFVLKSHKDEEQFLANWARDGNYMKSQYGMLSGQLHRSVGEQANIFVNIAIWESTEAFRRAFNDPEFKKHVSGYPCGVIAYPIILSKIAVSGVCVA
jgi:heme-degrading monooxygenase HmoA